MAPAPAPLDPGAPDPAPRRALIVGPAGDRGAQAGARALGQAGWTVGIGAPAGPGLLGAARAAAVRHEVPCPRGDGSDFIDGVRRALAEGSYDLVLGAGDDWTAAVSAYRRHIPAAVAHPAPEALAAALDEVGLAERASRAGLDVPRTLPGTDASLAAWEGPVVVGCRTGWVPGRTRPGPFAPELFPDAASAAARVHRIRAAGAEPVLRRPVHGRPGALIGVHHDGRLHGRVQLVTARLSPPPDGVPVRARTVPVDDALAARAEALLRGLGWWGLVELQFVPGEQGRPHLVGLGGRFSGAVALAEAARPGLADAWARLALGRPVPRLPDARSGVRCAWLAGDLRRAVAERRGGLAADVADTLRWGLVARHGVEDPLRPGPDRRPVSRRSAGGDRSR
ncbi:hypothetical protein ACFYE2_08705 [Kocuria sp. CPCC 205300]|uniref:hypothetical protein n=1 Tax=Kocuria sabuli TaxID=3071448 RepID=UPI0036DA6EBF